MDTICSREEWLAFSRRGRRVLGVVLGGAAYAGSADKFESARREGTLRWMVPVNIGQEFLEVLRSPTAEEQILEAGRELQAAYREHVAELLRYLAGEGAAEIDAERLLAMSKTVHFLQFTLPCLLLYQDWPSRLLRRARSGDMAAAEQLLRLDSSLTEDDRIRELLNLARQKGDRERVQLLEHALAGTPPAISRKNLKMPVAAVLRKMSVALPEPLSFALAAIGQVGLGLAGRRKSGITAVLPHGKFVGNSRRMTVSISQKLR